MLTESERTRYGRQLMLDGWGEAGQAKLAASTVFVAGVGGLGSSVAIYLAAAGVGRLLLCDGDNVDLSDLSRQILYGDADMGRPKAAAAAAAVQRSNTSIEVVGRIQRMDADNIETLAGDADVIVDGLDNFPTRYVLNDLCLRRGIPLVHAGVWGLQTQLTFLQPPQTGCLRCLFPQAPPPSRSPVLGAAPGLAGCLQAMEVLKYLTGIGTTLAGRLLIFDGLHGATRTLRLRKDPACRACGGSLA